VDHESQEGHPPQKVSEGTTNPPTTSIPTHVARERAPSLERLVSASDLFRWETLEAPVVDIREPGGDGFVIRMRSRMVPAPGYGGILYAIGDIVTVVRGEEERHGNVLMATGEPTVLARRLDDMLRRPQGDLTVSLFDDGMTLRIEGDGHGSWSILCRPVPMPGPEDKWKTFPMFSFRLGVASMQRAIADLEALSRLLQSGKAPLR
jgi:hypothetical protein